VQQQQQQPQQAVHSPGDATHAPEQGACAKETKKHHCPRSEAVLDGNSHGGYGSSMRGEGQASQRAAVGRDRVRVKSSKLQSGLN